MLVFYMELFPLGRGTNQLFKLTEDKEEGIGCLWSCCLDGQPVEGNHLEGVLFKALEYCLSRMKDEPLYSN